MSNNDEQTCWEQYTQRKAELPPDLTPEEYEAAIDKIVDELAL